MQPLLHGSQLAGHKAVVVGAAVSGQAAAKLLAVLGASVRLLDRNPEALTPEGRMALAAYKVEICLGLTQRSSSRMPTWWCCRRAFR